MTKKIKLIVLLSSIIIGVLAVSGTVFGIVYSNQKRITYDSVYYGVYGEWFILPENDSVKVYYNDGKQAEVDANRVFIDDDKDYKILFKSRGKQTKSVLKVNVNKKPAVYVSKQVVYGVVNSVVTLPKVTAHDGVNALTPTVKVFKDKTEIDISNGFIPSETGEYQMVVSAIGKGVNAQEKIIPVYIEESESVYADKITSYDKPYGTKQIMFANHKSEYSTEVKFEDEQGSLKISSGSGSDISIINAEISNVSEYDALYFYVYSDYEAPMSFSVAWSYWIDSLKNGDWTSVIIEVDKLQEYVNDGGYDAVQDNVTVNNVNGLMMFVGLTDYNDYVYKDNAVYLSSIRGIKRVGVNELNQQIQRILANKSVTKREITTIEYQYSKLSKTERSDIKDYDLFQNLKIKKLLDDQNLNATEGKLLYFDHEIGLSQISLPWSDFKMKITDEKTYNNEKVLKIQVPQQSWGTPSSEVCFTIDQPFIHDVSEYDYVTFAVYFDHDNDLVLHNDDYDKKGLGVQSRQTLKPGEWNVVKLALGDMDSLKGSHVWIIEDDWKKEFGHDVDFYFSSFHVGIGNDDISGYKLAFDEASGLNHLENYNNANFEYVTDVKYGSELGSTKIYPGSNAKELESKKGYTAQLYAFINDANYKSYSGSAVFKTHVYYSGVMNQALYVLPKGYYDLSLASKTILKNGEWTEVFFYLPVGKSLDDYGLMIMDQVAGWQFKMTEAVYFGAFEFVGYYKNDNVEFDKPYGISHLQSVGLETISYDDSFKYGNESGSLKIGVDQKAPEIKPGIVSQIYLNFVNTNKVTENTLYKMHVYYKGENNYSLYLMRKGYYDKIQAKEYRLSGNGWTEIDFILSMNDSFENYSLLVMDENWEFAKIDNIYLSAIKKMGTIDSINVDFSSENGVKNLKSVWNAEFLYDTQIKYDNELGSTKIFASENSNGKQLYVNFNCAKIVNKTQVTYKTHVYNSGNKDAVLYVMKSNYWNVSSAITSVTLKAGEWTEVRFTIPKDSALSDYSLQITTGQDVFDSSVELYFADLKIE